MNIMTQTTLFEVLGPIDTNEGRGGLTSYGLYYQKDMANNVAQGKGVWGAPGEVRMVDGYLIGIDGTTKFVRLKDFHDVLSEPPENVVARAMSKLTDEECKALGLKV